jgi:hypothetical protein
VEFEVNTEIARPPVEAFDKMADARNEVHWNSQVSRSELVSDEPVGQGSRFTTVNRGKEYDATIATYERPARLVFAVTGAPMDITATFEFTGTDAGSSLHGSFEMRPKGIMKAMFPLLKPMVAKDLARQSQSFKTFCETS